jgi:hypothetical protein
MINLNENWNRLSRRELLAAAGLTAAGLALGTRANAHQDDQKPKVIVGSGEYTYECIHDWLAPPDDVLWGDTQGVCQDSHGRIYVTHTVHSGSKKKNAIVVFDKNGTFLNSWGDEFAGGGHGIEVRKEGKTEFLYHCDTAHRMVTKTTMDGKIIWQKGKPAEPKVYSDKDPFVPTNVAFSPNGDFYIADGYGSNWIHQYNIHGEWIRTFGGPGADDGKFRTCHGIWLDKRQSEPMLVITDRAAARNQYFTLDGKFVRIDSPGMRLPCYFTFHHDVMAVADLGAVVTLKDPDGKVIAALGDGRPTAEALRDHPRSDFIPGKFIHPHGAKYLQNGDLLIAEWIPIGRLTLLKQIRA